MHANRQWIPANKGRTGILIVTNAEPSSVTTIRCGVAMADRQHVPVAILSVLVDPLSSQAPRAGRLENLTGVRANLLRDQVSARVADATGTHRPIPIYVMRSPVGPAAELAAEMWGASLVVVGLGRPGRFGRPRRRQQLRQIVRHARRYVLAIAPTAPTEIGRTILTADFGGTSVAANERAVSLMSADAPVELVHVIPTVHIDDAARPRWTKAYHSAVRELFDYTEATLPQGPRRAPVTRMLDGDAAQALSTLARQEHADLIALGRHAPPTGDRCTIGPVLDAMLDAAPCSMLIAPAPFPPSYDGDVNGATSTEVDA